MITQVIVADKCKKNIIDLVKNLGDSKYILLKSYDVFRAYITEKMILPLRSETLDGDEYIVAKLNISAYDNIIKDKNFYKALRERFPLKLNKQKQRYL